MVVVGAVLGDGVEHADTGVLGAVVHRVDLDLLHVLHVHRLSVEVFLLDAVHGHVNLLSALTGHGDAELVSRVRLNLRHDRDDGERGGVGIGGHGREPVLLAGNLPADLRTFGLDHLGRPAHRDLRGCCPHLKG